MTDADGLFLSWYLSRATARSLWRNIEYSVLLGSSKNVTLTDGVPRPHIVAAADQRTHVSERPHGVLELDQI